MIHGCVTWGDISFCNFFFMCNVLQLDCIVNTRLTAYFPGERVSQNRKVPVSEGNCVYFMCVFDGLFCVYSTPAVQFLLCVCSELHCTGSSITLIVTDGQSQTFVNGSEVSQSCQLRHVSVFYFPLTTKFHQQITGHFICKTELMLAWLMALFTHCVVGKSYLRINEELV